MIHISTNSQDIFVLCVYIRAGAVYEDPKVAGISHLLEHLLFRTKSVYSSDELLKRLETVGGKFNAITSKDVTYFYISTSTEHWQQASDLLHTIVFDIAITAKDLEQEKKICQEELYKSSTSGDLVESAVLPYMLKDTLYEKSVIGTKDSIAGITMSDVLAYHKKHYKNGLLMCTCSSSIKKKVQTYLISKYNQKNEQPCNNALLQFDYLKPLKDPYVNVTRHIQQNVLLVCYRCSPYDSRQYCITELINYILSGSLDAILIKELREKKNMVYSMSVMQVAWKGAGMNLFSAPTSVPLLELYEKYLSTLQSFCKKFITKTAFKMHKRNFLLRQKLASKDIIEQTFALGLDYFYTGEAKTWDSFNRLMSSITYDEVWQVSKAMFAGPCVTIMNCDGKVNPNMKKRASSMLQDFINNIS
jgi:zinc protease